MQKGSAALLLLIAGLVIGVSVSVFFFGLLKLPFSPIPQTPFRIPTPVPKILPYINQKLGFEFQYLKEDFTIKEDTEEEFNKRGNGDFRKNFKGYVGYEPGKFIGAISVLDKTDSFDNSPFTIWVFNNDNNLTIKNWFKDYWYYPFLWGVFDYTSKGHVTPDNEATISGQTAKYKIVAYQPGKPKFIYIAKNKKMYLFRVIGETGDKILSGFQFKQ